MFAQHLCRDIHESSLPDSYRPMRDFVDEQSLLSEDPTRIAACFAEASAAAEELGIELRMPRTTVRAHPPGTSGPQARLQARSVRVVSAVRLVGNEYAEPLTLGDERVESVAVVERPSVLLVGSLTARAASRRR